MEEAVCTQEQLYCLQNKAINVQWPVFTFRFQMAVAQSGTARCGGVTVIGRLKQGNSSCSEEKSPIVPNPDPKEYYNNWKNDISLFPATN